MRGIAAVIIEEPPEIEFRDGLFYAYDATGCRAWRPNTFMRCFRTAAKAIQDYRATETAEVIEFPPRPHQAASS